MALSLAQRKIRLFGETRTVVQVLDESGEVVHVAESREAAVSWALSSQLMAKMAEGLPIDQAFDAVLGAGAYHKFAGEVYDTLRAKAAA